MIAQRPPAVFEYVMVALELSMLEVDSTGSTTNSGPRVALTVEATETCWLRGMGYLVD